MAAATLPDQTPAVVKIAITDEGLADQVPPSSVHRAVATPGCSLDLPRQALLLEALGTSLEHSGPSGPTSS